MTTFDEFREWMNESLSYYGAPLMSDAEALADYTLWLQSEEKRTYFSGTTC